MATEYYAVVLHFTPRLVQLGFVGEPRPHVELGPHSSMWNKFIPVSPDGIPRQYPGYLGTQSHALDFGARTKLVAAIENQPALVKVVDQYNADFARNTWTNWHTNEFRDLARLVKHCVSSSLLISAARCKLFVVDSGFLAVEKFQLGSALLGHGACAAFSFLPLDPLCAIAACLDDAIVVNFAWLQCTVAVLADLRTLVTEHYTQYSEESVHYGSVANIGSGEFEEVEQRLLGAFADTDDTDDSHLLHSELKTLAASIAKLILTLELDTRAKVAPNIVFVGRLPDIPGFKTALLKHLKSQVPHLPISGKQCLGAWAGASLYCSTTLLRQENKKWKHREISKDRLDTEAWREFQEVLS